MSRKRSTTASASQVPQPASVKRRRVLLLIESSREYGRGCLKGIASYLRHHDHWNCLHLEREQVAHLDTWLKRWPADGVIARLEDPAVASRLVATRVPVIDLLDSLDMPGITRVWTPPDLVCRAVVDHFVDRGFSRFAYCGYPGIRFSDGRSDAFGRLLRQRGLHAEVYLDPSGDRRSDYDTREAEGVLHEDELCKWVAALPKPVAVMACNDVRGQQVVDACARAGVRVPEQVAVVGVDNDEVVCGFSKPSLSSVELDLRGIGYQAAVTLDAMMRDRRRRSDGRIVVKPLGVVPRLSSDVTAVDDEMVLRAIGLIRERAFSGLNVEQILEYLPISRATLERRFARYFNRTPKEEIMRVRFHRAEQLLRETNLNLVEIALMCGSKTAAHFSVVFKSRAGITPGEYRNRARHGKGTLHDTPPKTEKNSLGLSD